MAHRHENRAAEMAFQYGALKIMVKQGNLLSEEDVDARVIPTPNYGTQDVDSYQIYRTLCASMPSDRKIRLEQLSKRIEPDKPPQIMDDEKPFMILTPVPYFRREKPALKKLSAAYLSCLQIATDHRCKSIAFPTIGCGASGFKVEDTIEVLYNALVEHDKSNNKPLEEIRIVVFKAEVHNIFVNAFLNFAQDKKRKLTLLDVTPSNPHRPDAWSRDEKPPFQQRGAGRTDRYEDDFDLDDDDWRRRAGKDRRSNLNPNSQEFKPSGKSESRPARIYQLSNKKTELHIFQGDITKTRVDAIVNAANETMLGGGGVDGVIHDAAGHKLYEACKAHKKLHADVRLPTGHSRILLSYDMSKTTYYIINTAGPRYDDNSPVKCKEDLTSCYKTSLALANLYDLETIAYTAISCGIFGYPIDKGAEVALRTVDREADDLAKILFVLLDDEIYDAWVRKARELEFTALDGLDPPKLRVPSSDAKKHYGWNTENPDGHEEKKQSDASPKTNAEQEPPDADHHSPSSEWPKSGERRSPDKTQQKLSVSEAWKKRNEPVADSHNPRPHADNDQLIATNPKEDTPPNFRQLPNTTVGLKHVNRK